MKSVQLSLGILFLLVFTGLNGAFGQWGNNGSHIYNTNSGNVGIGNNSPLTLLHVQKLTIEPTITIENLGGTGGATYTMVDQTSGANWKFKATNSGGFKIRDHANLLDVIVIEPNSMANSIYIDAGGKIAMRQNVTNGHGLNVINYTAGKAAVQGTDQFDANLYATGMLGFLEAGELGLPVEAYNIGVMGIKPALGINGAGVYGWNTDDNTNNYGGVFVADGTAIGTGYSNYGVFGMAKHATNSYAGKFIGRVEVTGNATSTDAPDYASTVLKASTSHTLNTDTKAIEGVAYPVVGYGIGVHGSGGWVGVKGYADGTTYAGFSYGVYGSANGTAGTRIGVYGTATGSGTNWAGFFEGDVYVSSDMRIGTGIQATGYSLSIDGKVACEEVLVEDMANWPDYVFAEEYDLMTLADLEQSIKVNKHLPGMPSAAEVEGSGIMIGDMQRRLLEKVEELTLHTIELGKLIENQNQLISDLQTKLENLEKENANPQQ